MQRLFSEFNESFRIAFAQLRANKLRSVLTALGVIIGIVAVTLMGTAIRGIDTGFNRSLSMLGDDIVYVGKWPWVEHGDWWIYRNRPDIRPDYAVRLNRIIAATPNSLLAVAVPAAASMRAIKAGDNQVNNVWTMGTNYDYSRILVPDFSEGRFFGEMEAGNARQVCVLGYDVADALFPNRSALGQAVIIHDQPFKVIGVLARQGSFLGIFSFDSQAIVPLTAYEKYFSANQNSEIRVKVMDKTRLAAAEAELTGAMRRVRGLRPGERDNFSINEQQAFKAQIDPVRNGIAMAGLFITGLSLFVGAIGIMNITFVSVKERTREIGTRKALGARRRTILLQFLIEAVSICLVGGVAGLSVAYGLFVGIAQWKPQLPVEFSPGLVLVGIMVSVLTGIVSGFAPALGASRLDPVVALRYE
ncbi:MAG TPA: ABC transporter permease [Opitutaceae bacterium]|nr:ABC transporter permease [Opitutaceae bacterium]